MKFMTLVVLGWSSLGFAGTYLYSDAAPLRFTLAQTARQPDASADLIRTKDGRLHVGRIIDRTPAGYLFRADADGTSYVIDYTTVEDVKSTSTTAPTTASPEPIRPPDPPPAMPSAALVPAQSSKFLLDSAREDLAKLQEEFDDNGLFSPVFKMILSVALFAIVPAAVSNNVAPVVPALLLVGGSAFGITGGIQLGLRLRARGRLSPRIEQQRAYIEKLEAWAVAAPNRPEFAPASSPSEAVQ